MVRERSRAGSVIPQHVKNAATSLKGNGEAFYWSQDSELDQLQRSQKVALKNMLNEIIYRALEPKPAIELFQPPLFILPVYHDEGLRFELLNATSGIVHSQNHSDLGRGVFSFLDHLYWEADNLASQSRTYLEVGEEVIEGEDVDDLVVEDSARIQQSELAVGNPTTSNTNRSGFPENLSTNSWLRMGEDESSEKSQSDKVNASPKEYEGAATKTATTFRTSLTSYKEFNENAMAVALSDFLQHGGSAVDFQEGEDVGDDGNLPYAESYNEEDSILYNQPSPKHNERNHPPEPLKRRFNDREEEEEEEEGLEDDYSPRTKKIRSAQKPRHPNAGRERNGPFGLDEHDQITSQVRARRAWEASNPTAPILRDQPFWENILARLHSRGQCLTRLTYGSLKNYWNREGRQRSGFEERVNGGKNGSLVASSQKPKGRSRTIGK